MDRARSRMVWEIAAESLGLATSPRVRPNPVLWCWFAYWGPLPQRYSIWVLYDVTSSLWVVRHLARIVAAALPPVVAVAVLFPGPLHLRVLTALVAGGCAVLFTATWINESTEHRLIQAGYDWGVGTALRSKRHEVSHTLRRW